MYSKLAGSTHESLFLTLTPGLPGVRQSQLTSSSPADEEGALGCRCAASTSGRAGRPIHGDRRLTRICERKTAVSGR